MARMGWVRVARLVALFSVSFLSAVALAISAYALAKDEHDAFDRVNLAAAILSVVALPAMILADICRYCGVLAYLVTEILSLGSLCVLWLTALIVTPSRHPTCSAEPSMPCHHHTYALRILASLSFVILFIYTLTILIKAVLVRGSPASHRPVELWTGTVRDVLDPVGAHVHLSSASSSPLGKDTFMIEGVFDPFRRSSPSARPITVVIDREMLPVDEIIRSPPPACTV